LKNRLVEVDFIRTIAALAVIAIHVTADYAADSAMAFLLNQVVRFAVPLFVLLSGLLLSFGDRARSNVGYAEFIRKRTRKILVPYIMWTLIYTLMTALVSARPGSSIGRQLLLNLWLGSGSYHLYFIVVIFQLYLIYPALFVLVKRQPLRTNLLALAVTAVSQTILFLNQQGVLALPPSPFPYFEMLPVWLLFFVVGITAGLRWEAWLGWLTHHTHALGALGAVSLAWVVLEGRLTGTYASSIRPAVIVYSITTGAILASLALRLTRKRPRQGAALTWLSSESFFVYLAHPLVLAGLRFAASQAGLAALWSGDLGMLTLYGATVFFTVAAVWLASHFRVCRLIGGVYAGAEASSEKRVASSE
jgi:surface polysaccharide O-acyltransferase-like enzyme